MEENDRTGKTKQEIFAHCNSSFLNASSITYIMLNTLTLCWIYLPWYIICSFIFFSDIIHLCLHFSKVLENRSSFAQNSQKFNFAEQVKLKNSSSFNFLCMRLINCCNCPNVCSVISIYVGISTKLNSFPVFLYWHYCLSKI